MSEAATNGKNNKSKSIYWGYLACSVITSIVLIVLVGLFFLHVVDVSFLSDAACRQIESSRYYDKFTYCFYGSDWDEETYLAAVSGFYSTLIAVLVAVQALISWLSFAVIRSSNKQSIEEEIEKEIPYFFRTKDADRLLEDALTAISADAAKNAIKGLRQEDDKAMEALQKLVYEELQPALEGARGEIEELQVKIEALKNGDDYDEDAEVVVDQKGKLTE
ncbi:hypothetical protein [uncultured Tateyamaria sp.]|uniref:hypothetical protein n=1 Tax=uncultured Tateyamaria sp. TaxID=455651 RepID=UPI002614FC4D|nr:hypothetical protein [uncultured Tateyamaria sp.]